MHLVNESFNRNAHSLRTLFPELFDEFLRIPFPQISRAYYPFDTVDNFNAYIVLYAEITDYSFCRGSHEGRTHISVFIYVFLEIVTVAYFLPDICHENGRVCKKFAMLRYILIAPVVTICLSVQQPEFNSLPQSVGFGKNTQLSANGNKPRRSRA